MRILFPAIGSYVSGLEVVTLHLIRKLKEEGHEIKCVVNGWNDGVFISELQKLGVPFEQVKLGWLYLRKPQWTLDSLIHLPRALLAYRRIFREFDPDVCHFINFASVILLYPLLKNRACVYNLQEPHEPSRKHLIIYRILRKRIAIFTAVSKYIEKVLLDLGVPGDRIRLVYNGVPVIQEHKPKEEKNIPVFGIIGQVVSWKGHATLIDAVGLLTGEHSFLVKIFGNDKTHYAGELKKKMVDSGTNAFFSWEGFVKDQELIYDQVDVVIVPSLSQEPCSLTILESMMRGKSLIVSDRGGNPELIQHGETGLVFKAGDPVRLAENIRIFLEDGAWTLPLGDRAHAIALQRFTVEKMTAVYEDVYSNIVKTTQSPATSQ